jgi:hypothetical protein
MDEDTDADPALIAENHKISIGESKSFLLIDLFILLFSQN